MLTCDASANRHICYHYSDKFFFFLGPESVNKASSRQPESNREATRR